MACRLSQQDSLSLPYKLLQARRTLVQGEASRFVRMVLFRPERFESVRKTVAGATRDVKQTFVARTGSRDVWRFEER